MKFVFALGGSCVLATCALFDCGSSPETCDDASTCGDAAAVPGVSGGGCDSTKPASQGGCSIDDTDGFFVSPNGSDTADGSKTTPFLTIGKGILAAAAAAQKPNVYVCAGTYPENLVIQNAPAGVALHGGFDCASWTQMSAPTTVAPAWQTGLSAQFVLHVLGVAAVVESMTLTAPDATDPGMSSIAAYIDGSDGMTFRRATITAGNGSDAPAGTPLTALAANSNGNSVQQTAQQVPGAAITCPCKNDSTTGGVGGFLDDAGAQGGLPVIASDPDGGKPGVQGACGGGQGASGVGSTNGSSTGTLGGLTSAGWVASAGGLGDVGATAQGGGGGNWNDGNGLAGGGGACGGCGGSGGAGGAGGGASIAIGALSSTIRIRASTIHAGKAGNGADGVIGQPGQPGGTGGVGAGNQCSGGNGGTGGAGGSGGGGAGGISVAVAFTPNNATPDVDNDSAVLAGTAGSGGKDTASVKAIDGIAQPIHGF
jgi:hypothetical protein